MDAAFPNTPNQSANGLARAGTGMVRALTRRCPFCGAKHVFKNWFSLKPNCPGCGSIFEPEDGYMLGSYVVNLGVTALVGVLYAFLVVFKTDLSVATLQISAVALMILVPLFFYGFAQLVWISIDLIFNSTAKFHPNRVRHT